MVSRRKKDNRSLFWVKDGLQHMWTLVRNRMRGTSNLAKADLGQFAERQNKTKDTELK